MVPTTPPGIRSDQRHVGLLTAAVASATAVHAIGAARQYRVGNQGNRLITAHSLRLAALTRPKHRQLFTVEHCAATVNGSVCRWATTTTMAGALMCTTRRRLLTTARLPRAGTHRLTSTSRNESILSQTIRQPSDAQMCTQDRTCKPPQRTVATVGHCTRDLEARLSGCWRGESTIRCKARVHGFEVPLQVHA